MDLDLDDADFAIVLEKCVRSEVETCEVIDGATLIRLYLCEIYGTNDSCPATPNLLHCLAVHTHLLPPEHGSLMLWGVDELLT